MYKHHTLVCFPQTNSLLLGFYLRKIELATLTGRAAELCGWALCPGLVLQLCGWALCPGLVLLLTAPLSSVAGLCGPALSPLRRAPELCGWALCPGLVVAGLCVQALSELCGWALCPGLVLRAAGALGRC